MTRILIGTGIALMMALTPALAADPATQSGGADTSTGAKEQSSAPPFVWSSRGREAGRGHEAIIRIRRYFWGRQGTKFSPTRVVCR